MGARIPASFMLGSLRYRVRQVGAKALERAAGTDWGIFLPDKQEIIIPKPGVGGISEPLREQVFYHELGHAILYTCNAKDYGNETVIDAMGHALKQYMDTAK